MVRRMKKGCAHHLGCEELVDSPERFCAEHKAEGLRSQNKKHEAQRGYHRAFTAKVYNSARWKRLRAYVLSREPLCRRCGGIATDVDHQTDMKDGGDPWKMEGLQPLCKSCHSTKTMTERYK